MSPFQQALGNAKLAIMSLVVCLFFSVLGNIVLGIALASVPSHLPPLTINRVPDNGLQLKVGAFPKVSAYLIAKNQWEWLNTWSIDGVTDAAGKIQASLKAGLITPKFADQYRQILDGLKTQKLTSGYKQVTTQYEGDTYHQDDVKPYGDGMVVNITMTSLFYYRADSELTQASNLAQLSPQDRFNLATKPLKAAPIQQITVQYQFIVRPAANKYGMAVAGILGQPKFINKTSNFAA